MDERERLADCVCGEREKIVVGSAQMSTNAWVGPRSVGHLLQMDSSSFYDLNSQAIKTNDPTRTQ